MTHANSVIRASHSCDCPAEAIRACVFPFSRDPTGSEGEALTMWPQCMARIVWHPLCGTLCVAPSVWHRFPTGVDTGCDTPYCESRDSLQFAKNTVGPAPEPVVSQAGSLCHTLVADTGGTPVPQPAQPGCDLWDHCPPLSISIMGSTRSPV